MSQAVATKDNDGLLNFIERASRDPEFDVGKFGELLRMQREIVTEQARREFNAAMAAAQAEMLPVIRDATNTHTNSKYAKLEKIDREMRPTYTKHGFAVRYGSEPSPTPGWIRIVCTVSLGGYSETNYLDAPPDVAGSQGRSNKTGVQAVGATVTYLRRYLLTMVFNVVLADDEDDDDGERRRGGDRRDGHRKPPDGLDEPNGTIWLRNLRGRLGEAQARQEVVDLRGDKRVSRVLEDGKTPTLIKGQIEDMFSAAFARFETKTNGEDASDPASWPDPVAELIAEVDEMDLIRINALDTDAQWRARVREAAEFPPDGDRLVEAIAARKAALQQGRQ